MNKLNRNVTLIAIWINALMLLLYIIKIATFEGLMISFGVCINCLLINIYIKLHKR